MRATAKRYTEDFKEMIIEVYKTGKPIKEICEEYGVTYTYVERWLLAENQQEKKISPKHVVKKTIKK
ncbi:transposase IS3/IS911 family protein [Clostridium carnis]|uniref:Transposase IS3/IS911 family protein n=1 Tax=Clostridium carnis TaxID=1530 RepID=A0ABY6SUX2_9CLOT|nr:transposase IS3/IS911 family protein [Clostridium carnis]